MSTRTKEIILLIIVILIAIGNLIYFSKIEEQAPPPPPDASDHKMNAEDQIQILDKLTKQSTATITVAEQRKILGELSKPKVAAAQSNKKK